MNWWDGIPYVDLTDVTIPASVIELVPESVARENTILPLAYEDGAIEVVTADPTDFDTIQKLQIVCNAGGKILFPLRPGIELGCAWKKAGISSRKPFGFLAEGLLSENSRGDWI